MTQISLFFLAMSFRQTRIPSPKLSVIIPYHNNSATIWKACDSILDQDLSDVEVLIVDNGSDDRSVDVISEIANRHSNVHLLTENKAGAGHARNLGISQSRGKYIHFLDADDWLTDPTIYSRSIRTLEESHSDFLLFYYTRYCERKGKEERQVQLLPYSKPVSLDPRSILHLLFSTSVVPWNKIYNRQFVVDNSLLFDGTQVANDRTFHFLSASRARRISIAPEYPLSYRVNQEKSLTGTSRNNFLADVLRACISTAEKLSVPPEDLAFAHKANLSDIFHLMYSKALPEQIHKAGQLLSRYIELIDEHADISSSSECAKAIFNDITTSKEYEYLAIQSEYCSYVREGLAITPIVLCTDEKYAPFASVALESIIANRDPSNLYNLYVLHSNIEETDVAKLISQSRPGCNVIPLSIDKYLDNSLSYERAHYSKAMYYRLEIPHIFAASEFSIYVDCDLVVLRDIYEILELCTKRTFPLFGARNFFNESMYRWVVNMLKLDPESYINSGVLVFYHPMYLQNLVKDMVVLESVNHSFLACPDQDLLNIVCKSQIGIIHSSWNFQWHHNISEARMNAETIDCSATERDHAMREPWIVHYTSGKKPWSFPDYDMSELFWQYAKTSPYFNEICVTTRMLIMDRVLKHSGVSISSLKGESRS